MTEYFGGDDMLAASGAGCPPTGGAPSATAPGVFVTLSSVGGTDSSVSMEVVGGQVVYTPDTFYPEVQGVYAPLDGTGSWNLEIGFEFGSPPLYELEGFCTTMIELTPDGLSIDAGSVERARFVSPSFHICGELLGSTTTTLMTGTTVDDGIPCYDVPPTSATTSVSTSSDPSTTVAIAPSSTAPRFTG